MNRICVWVLYLFLCEGTCLSIQITNITENMSLFKLMFNIDFVCISKYIICFSFAFFS